MAISSAPHKAASEIADKFIEHATESGPGSISFAMGTAMIVKRATFSALFRFANATGIVMPETFAGVGDLPVGAYMTLGVNLPGDNMAAVYKSKCVLVWASGSSVAGFTSTAWAPSPAINSSAT